jgi:hypothetical protein
VHSASDRSTSSGTEIIPDSGHIPLVEEPRKHKRIVEANGEVTKMIIENSSTSPMDSRAIRTCSA